LFKSRTFDESLELTVKFITDNKRKPSISSEDSNEVRLASWIITQRSFASKNKLKPENLIKWNNFMQQFINYYDNEQFFIFTTKLNEFEQIFLIKHRKISFRANDLTPEERKLLEWFQINLRRYNLGKGYFEKDKFKEKMADILRRYHHYFKDEWLNNLNELDAFITINKEIPDHLYTWFHSNLSNYRRNKLGKKSRQEFDAFFKKHRYYTMTKDETWTYKLNCLDLYMKEHNAKPPEYSPIDELRLLRNWLGHQILNYNNQDKAMKITDQYRRVLFYEFTKTHRGHFDMIKTLPCDGYVTPDNYQFVIPPIV
jgi:hypothetical protein